jgi:hypothetical protein
MAGKSPESELILMIFRGLLKTFVFPLKLEAVSNTLRRFEQVAFCSVLKLTVQHTAVIPRPKRLTSEGICYVGL